MKRIFYFYTFSLILFGISDLYSQSVNSTIVELKSKKFDDRVPNWSECLVDGVLDSKTFVDSLGLYSVVLPKNFYLKNTTENINGFVRHFKNRRNELADSVYIDIKVQRNIESLLKENFDVDLIQVLKNRELIDLGTFKVGEKGVYWIESRIKDEKESESGRLSFYLIHPNENVALTISITSYNSLNYHLDYCVLNLYLQQVKWLN
jgi:DNA-dependent RNA polymerase auxiliary subunit epsilon